MTVPGIVSSDFTGLNELKIQAAQDAKSALPEVAKQFEGIFLQSMLKSMRMGQHFLDENSPFRGRDRETFQEMLDAQYASNIASSRGVGLADMLTQQLTAIENKANSESVATHTPAFELNPPAQQDEVLSTEKNQAFNHIDDFVQSLWPKAKEAASVIGLDPKILMAQAALETGWGKFIAKDANGSSSNNLFNIKAGNNNAYDTVDVKTTEYIADTPIKMNASFRKYPSIEQSFNDYISLIKGNERYQNALANAQDPEHYVYELHKAGYATDPRYSAKILSIYRGDELNQAMQRCGLSEQV